MHRLKQWFGLKDWDGPQPSNQNSQKDGDQKDAKDLLQGEAKKPVVSGASVPKAAQSTNMNDSSQMSMLLHKENIREVADNGQNLSLSEKTELWLKQYIPHKPDTCVGCKLVAMTTISLYSVGVGVFAWKKAKTISDPRLKRPFFSVGFFSMCMGLSYVYLKFYDEDPLEALIKFTKKNKAESED